MTSDRPTGGRRRRVAWSVGALFGVPLPDGSLAVGQAVALMMPNVVYCALTRVRIPAGASTVPEVGPVDVTARVALTREELDQGAWRVLGEARALSPKGEFANEAFARKGYIGATVYDATVAADFLEAYHGFAFWDDWADPRLFDQWLVAPHQRPDAVRLKGRAPPA